MKKRKTVKSRENKAEIKTINLDRKIKNTTKDKFRILYNNYQGTLKNLSKELNISQKEIKQIVKNDFKAPAQTYKNISKAKIINKIEKYSTIDFDFEKLESIFMNNKLENSLVVIEYKQGKNSIYKSIPLTKEEFGNLDLKDIINSKINDFRNDYKIKKLVGISLKYGKSKK